MENGTYRNQQPQTSTNAISEQNGATNQNVTGPTNPRKRPRDDVPNCGCEDRPLMKRINRLNIEHNHQPQHQHSNPFLHGGQSPATASTSASNVDLNNDDTSSTNSGGFEENYPFEPDSSYYSQNHLLYHLHMERQQRMIQQQHRFNHYQGFSPQQQQQRPGSASSSCQSPSPPQWNYADE